MSHPRISIQEYLIYLQLFLSLFVISVIPSAFAIQGIFTYLQLGFFLIFIYLELDFEKLRELKLPKFTVETLLMFLLLFFLVVGSFFINMQSNSDFKSISKILSYIPLFILFFLYLPSRFLDDVEKFEKLLSIFIIIGVINSLFGWFALLSGISVNKSYPGFLLGLFQHPNTTGFIYSLSIPVLIYKLINKKINKFYFSVLIIVLSLSLLFSYARSAYISTGISILILTYAKQKKIFLFSVFLIALLSFTVIADFTMTKGGLSSMSRVLLFATAIDMIMSDAFHFMWGYGVFNFLNTFFTEKMFIGSFEVVVDPHNFILLLGIQFGMVFTFTFLTFIILILVKSIRAKKLNMEMNNLRVLCISMIINLLIHNLFEDIIVYPEYFVMPVFLIYLGFVNKLNTRAVRE